MRRLAYTSGSAAAAGAWQQQLRSELARALHLDDLFAEAGSLTFDQELVWAEEREGYTFQELEVNATPARRIRILQSLPAPPVPRPVAANGMTPRETDAVAATSLPAVVCIHGHGGDRTSVYDPESIYRGFARQLAASGYATIATDVGQHEVGERGRTLMGERLWDLIRCIDYVQQLPEVQGTRVGCAGLSLGGEMAMWLGAMDERVAATFSAGFLTTMDQLEQNHCRCWEFDGLRELADWADIYSLIAPRALTCQNGLAETPTQFYVPIARQAMTEIEVIYADLDHPERVKLDVHEGGHEIELSSLEEFFASHL